ncbi:MAG: hypothetical protein WAM90_17655 [Rhodanobacter sp.]
MQTLKLSVSMPDETHPDMELRLSANDSSCDVVIALPMHSRSEASAGTTPVVTVHGAASSTDTDSLRGTNTNTDASRDTSAEDDYVLGGYAGI